MSWADIFLEWFGERVMPWIAAAFVLACCFWLVVFIVALLTGSTSLDDPPHEIIYLTPQGTCYRLVRFGKLTHDQPVTCPEDIKR